MMKRILAVDDNAAFLAHLKGLLQTQQYTVDTLTDPQQVLPTLSRTNYHCILLDVKMPGQDGISLLEQLKRQYPQIPVVMISGQSTLSIAVDAIKLGAFDFIEKGGDTERLLITLKNAIDRYTWYQERHWLLQELIEQFQMVGQSAAMQTVFHQIETVAPTNAKVLITGETGTGKELVARAIHLRSRRATRPYVKVNCAAIPETLIESIFFGYRKGSFTGALRDQPGKFEEANGGTIFLDEIGELPLTAQAKLLTVLQEGEIEKIGELQPQKVDVRVIAATNKNLSEMVKKGEFRDDLYHRLNIIHIHLPPLRDRREDIPILTEYFLKQLSEEYNKSVQSVAPAALQLMLQYHWPGNIRMLRHVLERAVIFTESSILSADEIALSLESFDHVDARPATIRGLNSYLEAMEKQYLRQTLLITQGNKARAAELLAIDRATLWRKLKKYGLANSDYPSSGKGAEVY